MLEARKASYLKVIAATMKPPARPDKPAESIQPVQPAQPMQTSQLEQQAKPVQPVQPVVQNSQKAQSSQLTTSSHLLRSPSQIRKNHSPRNSMSTVSNGSSIHSLVRKHMNTLHHVMIMYAVLYCRIN